MWGQAGMDTREESEGASGGEVMKILGVNERWPKLKQEVFTTFRFGDWFKVGERVQVVLHPRSKRREVLCIADIIGKEPRWMRWWLRFVSDSFPGVLCVSNDEA